MSDQVEWEVRAKQGVWLADRVGSKGVWAQASCHHRRRAGAGACGGCYARLYEALSAISNGQHPAVVIAEVFARMKAEAPKRRGRT